MGEVEIAVALLTLLGSVFTTALGSKMSSDATNASVGRAEQFSREATLNERGYNSPINEKQRLIDAGATEGGALQSVLGATPYISPPMQSVAPVNNASNIASLMSSLGNSFGSFGETVRDLEAARTDREMRPVNVQKGYAEIKRIATENKWTEEQIHVAEATLRMAEGRYEREIKQMQQDFERGIVEIDNLLKQGELLTQQKDVNQSVIDANNASARSDNAKALNDELIAKVTQLRADYAAKYGVDINSNPFSFILQILMSDKSANLAKDVPENLGQWIKTIQGDIQSVANPTRVSFGRLLYDAGAPVNGYLLGEFNGAFSNKHHITPPGKVRFRN